MKDGPLFINVPLDEALYHVTGSGEVAVSVIVPGPHLATLEVDGGADCEFTIAFTGIRVGHDPD